jgi:hypothetical protein
MAVGQFVDIEGIAVDVFTAMLPDVRVVTELPGNIDGLVIIRVTRSPGANDALTSRPRTDVECFAPDRATMWQLAGRANNALASLSGHMYGGVQIDTVNTITDPVPGWWSPTVQRAVAVYEWDLRVF